MLSTWHSSTHPIWISVLALIAVAFSLLADSPALAAEPDPALPEEAPMPSGQIFPIKGLNANEECIQSILDHPEFKTTIEKLNHPAVVNSMEEAFGILTRDSMERFPDNLDFDRQKLLIFVWQGSEKDRLINFFNNAGIKVGTFFYDPQRPGKLVVHSMMYAVPKDAWIQCQMVNQHRLEPAAAE